MKSEYKSMSNDELWNMLQNDGDQNATATLRDRMKTCACNMLKGREDKAEDAVQNTWTSALDKMSDGTKLSWNYIYRILHNKCMDMWREDTIELKRKGTLIDQGKGKTSDGQSDPSILVGIVDEAGKLKLTWEKVIDCAGFLQPKEMKGLFKKECVNDDLPSQKIHELDNRVGLNPQICFDFLRKELSTGQDRKSSERKSIRQYREEIEKIIFRFYPGIDQKSVLPLTNMHMVSMPWPGWPFTPRADLCKALKNCPKRLSVVVSDVKNDCSPFAKSEVLMNFLKRIHYQALKLRLQWQWPFEISHRSTVADCSRTGIS